MRRFFVAASLQPLHRDQSKQNQNLEKARQGAEEVKILMKDNVEKVIEREGKLNDLDIRANELLSKATNFQKTAKTVERHTRWQKWRWYVISGIILLVVIAIIIIIIMTQLGGGDSTAPVAAASDPN
ncbi:vesicle-associated membrane protein 5-like [Pelodytes ibericus]